jgi:hypothetical protein
MAITITKPTVGGNEDTWGGTLNTALDTIVDAVNGTTGTTAPNLSTLTINSVDVTATPAELNLLDGDTAATSTTVVGTDRVVFNDGGAMKQVSMSDIATYTSAQVSAPTVNDSTITFSAGSDISITDGSLTTNQSSNKTITIAHGDTSTLNGATSNSGSNYIQNITVDDNGHVTAISASDASSNISSTFTRGTTSISTNSFTVAAGMYMIQLYSTSTNNGGNFPLPTTNLEFGMINHIMTSTNTANALGDCYAYDGTNWLKNNTGTNQTQLLLGNSTSGGQNMASAWGFLTFTGAATLTSTSYLRFNIIKVA